MQHVEMQVEEPARGPVEAGEVPLDDSGFVDFALAGTRDAGEFRCADCGYGAVVQRVLPQCPMCSSSVWERRGPLPSRRAG